MNLEWHDKDSYFNVQGLTPGVSLFVFKCENMKGVPEGLPFTGTGRSINRGLRGESFNNTASVIAGQTYAYYVIAKNANGGTQSNTITVNVPLNACSGSEPPPEPTAYSPVRSPGPTTNSATVTQLERSQWCNLLQLWRAKHGHESTGSRSDRVSPYLTVRPWALAASTAGTLPPAIVLGVQATRRLCISRLHNACLDTNDRGRSAVF